MSTRKTYTREFKDQVLEVVRNSPKSLRTIADEFGISYPSLINWKKSLEIKSDSSGSPINSDAFKKLKQEVELLRKENEILKKAATFFAKQLD